MVRKYRTPNYYKLKLKNILQLYCTNDKYFSLVNSKIISLLNLVPENELIHGEWDIYISQPEADEIILSFINKSFESYLWVYLYDITKTYYVFNSYIGKTETVMSAEEAMSEMRKIKSE